MDKTQQTKVVQELKRRGYSVSSTVDDGLLVEGDSFWGRVSYDTGIGKFGGGMKWGRTILLALFTLVGFIGIAYWYLFEASAMRQEILSILKGVS